MEKLERESEKLIIFTKLNLDVFDKRDRSGVKGQHTTLLKADRVICKEG